MVLHFFKSGYNKVKGALSKTRAAFSNKLRVLFGKDLDETTLEQLEELLFLADLGVEAATQLTQKIREIHQKNPSIKGELLLQALKQEILAMIGTHNTGLATGSPSIILIVGVNGNGKTTSVAKLAKRLSQENQKVLLGAADTFRAAATEQLDMWANKLNLDIVKGQAGADPAAVAFDAVSAAKARGCDVVLIDTAGRLHTKTPLMQELEKIRRSCAKVIPGSPQETLLVLDASTGQNAIEQAKTFNKHTPITGLILTKLDGTAKGGIVVSIQQKLGVPVKFIGTGEGEDDLLPFDPQTYVEALFES